MATSSIFNPFSIPYPTAVQTSLFSGALLSRFDPSGRFIAAARGDGSASIWDLDTKNAIRWLEGHVKAVTSIDWSRNSRYVLTSSKDWNVIIWDMERLSDVEPPQRKRTIRFDAPVVSASFHPRHSQLLLVLLSTGEAYVVDLRKDHKGRFELCDFQEEEDRSRQSAMTVARFDPSGKLIFVGTSSGNILVFNTRTKSMIARHKVSGAGIMRGLEFTKGGRRLTTNSSDRTLRLFNLPTYPHPPSIPTTPYRSQPSTPPVPPQVECILEQELEPIHRFNDPITKTAWHAMSFSPDGDWLAGGAADPATHKIYIWDIQRNGQFTTTLDGGREPLVHVHWHPSKPIIASTTNQGTTLIWHCPTPERWGAFAGGFEEVDENIKYEEREDEFDIEDESEMAERKMKEEERLVDIDGDIDEGPEQAMPAPSLTSARQSISRSQSRLATPAPGTPVPTPVSVNGNSDALDEDVTWAEEDPDDDLPGWKLKIVMEDERDQMRY